MCRAATIAGMETETAAACLRGHLYQRLKSSHEFYKILLLLFVQLNLQDQVEELYRIFQRQEPSVVKVGGRIFDAS